jgi:hypothetical protein
MLLSIKIEAYVGYSIAIIGITSLISMHRNEISMVEFIVIEPNATNLTTNLSFLN